MGKRPHRDEFRSLGSAAGSVAMSSLLLRSAEHRARAGVHRRQRLRQTTGAPRRLRLPPALGPPPRASACRRAPRQAELSRDRAYPSGGQHHDDGGAVVEAAELSLSACDLSVRVTADQVDAAEHLRNRIELEAEHVTHAQPCSYAIE